MELQLNKDQQAVADQKKTTWGNFGVSIYMTELQLQSMADLELNKLAELPANIFDVPAAEIRLTAGKKSQKTIEDKRMEITTRLDDLTKRLMTSEKSLTPAIDALSAEIIKIKKQDEADKKKKKQTDDELVTCKEFYQNEAIKIDTALKNTGIDLVSRCYNKALETNIAPAEIDKYIADAKSLVTVNSFGFTEPKFVFAHITEAQNNTIKSENFKIDRNAYVSQFGKDLDEKFSDYEVAFNNKSEALALSQKQEEEKKSQNNQQATQQQVANKIEAAAVTTSAPTFFTKPLKKSYAVDMEENCENALAIIAAFSANIHLCMKHVKISKWFGFSATQAGTALSKVKSEDNAFEPVGITFKEVEKL